MTVDYIPGFITVFSTAMDFLAMINDSQKSLPKICQKKKKENKYFNIFIITHLYSFQKLLLLKLPAQR